LTEWTDYTIRIYSGNSGGFETIGKTIQFQTPISGINFFKILFSIQIQIK